MAQPSRFSLSIEACINAMKHLPQEERLTFLDGIKQSFRTAESNTIETSKEQILALSENLAVARAGYEEAGAMHPVLSPSSRR